MFVLCIVPQVGSHHPPIHPTYQNVYTHLHENSETLTSWQTPYMSTDVN